MRWYLIEYTKGKQKFADVRRDAGGGDFYQIAKEVPIDHAFLIQSAPKMKELLDKVLVEQKENGSIEPIIPQIERLMELL